MGGKTVTKRMRTDAFLDACFLSAPLDDLSFNNNAQPPESHWCTVRKAKIKKQSEI